MNRPRLLDHQVHRSLSCDHNVPYGLYHAN